MQALSNTDKRYEKFRWFFTKNNILVVGGKSDSQNELALKEFLKPEYVVLHTTKPGSPFMIVQEKNPKDEDITEAAIFCACFSHQWKNAKKEIEIDIFKASDIYKNNKMKVGTFGVKGKKKTIKVRPELAIVVQKGKLRAVPISTNEKKIAYITQGKLTKEEAGNKILKIIKDNYHLPITKEEIMSAIPSDKLSIKEAK